MHTDTQILKSRKTHRKGFMAFICGSFNNQEEDDFKVLWPSCPPTPSRKTRRHKFCCRKNKADNKNPYSNRGLDKFEALLADLDDKKQKIFTQKGSQYISFVRFVYSNSNDVKPIIVRLRDPMKHDKDLLHKRNNFKETKSISLPKLQSSTLDHHHHQNQNQNSEPPGAVTNAKIEVRKAQQYHAKPSTDRFANKIRVDQWKLNMKRKLVDWWTPSYNLPLFVIMVLVFLTFFGRSLAIICTSIAWYMIPTIDGALENTSPKPKKMIKNEYSRKPSENKIITSPKPFLSGPINVQHKHKMKKLTSF